MRNDFVGARLVVDGVAFRQSGSHMAAFSSFESSAGELIGNLILFLEEGSHAVKLQWKKWGKFVRSWACQPNLLDGFSGGRSLVATGYFKNIEFKQPTTGDRIIVAGAWKNIKGMALSFSLIRDSEVRIGYVVPAQPSSAPRGSLVATPPDYLETRIVVDGVPYREGASSFSSMTKSFRGGTLLGYLTIKLKKGTHSAQLQWKKFGNSVGAWWIQPTFLDGFVSGRSLSMVELWYPPFSGGQYVDQVLMSLKTAKGSRRLAEGKTSKHWHNLKDTTIGFTLVTNSTIDFLYTVNFERHGLPSRDSWTWDRWS